MAGAPGTLAPGFGVGVLDDEFHVDRFQTVLGDMLNVCGRVICTVPN
jgi:hypothetical protein